MTDNISKILALSSGQSEQQFQQSALSQAQRNAIDTAIEKIFSGTTILNWICGGQLHAAWARALDQTRDWIFALPDTSPAISYLRTACFNHRARWQRIMTASEERNQIANITKKSEYDELRKHANDDIAIGQKLILEIVAGTATTARKHDAPTPNNQTMTHAYMHENEYVRTREK